MRNLLFLLLLLSFLNADYLNSDNNHCVVNLAPYPDNKGYCWSDLHNSTDYCDTKVKLTDFEDGYYYDSGLCLLNQNLSTTGLTQNEWDYLLAILAHVLGFTFLFLINYISILIVKNRG